MTTRYDRHIVKPRVSKLVVLFSLVGGVAVVAILLFAYNLRALQPWQPYQATDGSFRCSVPAPPQQERAGFMCFQNNFSDFLSVESAPIPSTAAPEHLFLAHRIELVGRARGKLLYEKELDVKGMKACEFQVERPMPVAARITCRMIATPTGMWIVCADIVEGPGADEDARRFIESFEALK